MYYRVKAARVRCLLVIMMTSGCLGLCSLASGQPDNSAAATIRRLDVLSHSGNFELEILASQPVRPTTLLLTGPDRLVIDFPNAIPGPELHAIAVKGVHVRDVRAGLFASNPSVARIVVDLDSPQAYEIFPSGNSVIVKINSAARLTTVSSGASSRASSQALSGMMTSPIPSVVISSPAPPPPEPPKPVPTLRVEFSNGKLWVSTDKAMLGEVLRAIGLQIGASVSVPPQADREPVVAHLGPAPAREVVSALLNGAPYNIVLMGSGHDLSRVTSIVLTPRGPAAAGVPANNAPAPIQEAAPVPEPEPTPLPPPVEATPQQPTPDTLPPTPQ